METIKENLEKMIKQIDMQQNTCIHDWKNPEYYPEQREIVREEYPEDIGLDSDFVPVIIGTGKYETINRLSKVCSKCQKRVFLDEQEATIEIEKKPMIKKLEK